MYDGHRNSLPRISCARLERGKIVIQVFSFGADLRQCRTLVANRGERGFQGRFIHKRLFGAELSRETPPTRSRSAQCKKQQSSRSKTNNPAGRDTAAQFRFGLSEKLPRLRMGRVVGV